MIQIQLQRTSVQCSSVFMKSTFFYGWQCLSFIFFNLPEKTADTISFSSLPLLTLARESFFFGHTWNSRKNREQNGPGEADGNLFSINRKRFSLNAEFTHFLSSLFLINMWCSMNGIYDGMELLFHFLQSIIKNLIECSYNFIFDRIEGNNSYRNLAIVDIKAYEKELFQY